jgi:hypothetical protein
VDAPESKASFTARLSLEFLDISNPPLIREFAVVRIFVRIGRRSFTQIDLPGDGHGLHRPSPGGGQIIGSNSGKLEYLFCGKATKG